MHELPSAGDHSAMPRECPDALNSATETAKANCEYPSTESPAQVLQRYFGYSTFRAHQEDIVRAVLTGRDVLAVMPTGAGKSVCYQVPAMLLPGLTVVVSPLISLMKDQVSALRQNGIPAAFLNSTLSAAARTQVLREARDGACKLLYVAPERLDDPAFRNLAQSTPISLVAVDEAHCVSQWGQDFRPSYTRICGFVDSLPQRPPVCAFTATATARVRDDIREILRLNSPFTVVSSFDRPNLRFETQRPRSKDAALLSICQQHASDCGIVYCSTTKTVEKTCELLQANGVNATRYHAKLSDAERRKNQDDFIFDRSLVMVATTAFGMGIDKSNVSFVVHYNMPMDLESYYQEAGRAGRDGSPATCTLLYSPKDVSTCQFLLEKTILENPDLDVSLRVQLLERGQERIKQMTFYATTTDCLRGFILRYFGERPPALCENCSNCSTQFEEQDVSTEALKIVSCVYRLRERERTVGRTTIADILVGSGSQKMLDAGYDSLSTFGIMRGVSKKRILFVLDRLIEADLLSAQGGQYPMVAANANSARFLKERTSFVIKVPKEPAVKARTAKPAGVGKGAGAATPVPAASQHGDEALFEQLRTLRASLAQQQEVPAYVVFHNTTLQDMALRKPRTREQLLECSGVGEVKANRYGEAFLECIAAWAEDHQ